ncbi:MAG: DUF1223 domain-containing protein [Pseudolabrys sp.]
MKHRSILLAAALLCAAVSQASAGTPRAVVQLFTSQGCSSCPPADRLMGRLARDPTLVTMSLPVDYWDYLGWKDTLALHGNSTLQRDYAITRGDREVYTPQAVINGVVHALGSDKGAIERAVARTQSKGPLAVPVKVAVAGGKVKVHVPAATGSHKSGEVWLFPITDRAQVKIGRGENRGRTLSYYNVVRRWVKLGDWRGQPEDFTLPLSKLPDAKFSLQDVDHVAVLLQSGFAHRPGLVLGAATASLRAPAVQ